MIAVLGHFKDKFMINTTDGGTSFYFFAFSYRWCDLVQVGIDRMKTIGVLDDDNIVKQLCLFSQNDLAVEYCFDFGITLVWLQRYGFVIDLDLVDRISVGAELFNKSIS